MPLSLFGVAISDLSGDDISPVSASQPESQKPNSRWLRLAKNWLCVMASTDDLEPDAGEHLRHRLRDLRVVDVAVVRRASISAKPFG